MNLFRASGIGREGEEEEEEEEEVREGDLIPPPSAVPPPPPRCPIAVAANGSELEPTVRFLRDFRDNVVLKSRYKRVFEEFLEIYYCFSSPIARNMEKNEAFKQFIKYFIILPTVTLFKIIVQNIEKMLISTNRHARVLLQPQL